MRCIENHEGTIADVRTDEQSHKGHVTAWVDGAFGIDLRTLALFRVLLGAYLVADLMGRARDLTAHYTDFGVLPRDAAIDLLSASSMSLHLVNGSFAVQSALFTVAGAAAVALIFGWQTRWATCLSWFLLLSVQNRNTLILSGEDNLALLLLFWSMFLPLGARYSIDEALNPSPVRRGHRCLSVWSGALLVQGMSMYFFSALLKSDPVWMPDGTAVYYALNLEYFATPFALWFREFEALLSALTYAVWSLELVGPILMFVPLLYRYMRPALVLCFVTMHIGFWLCLEIGLFPVISIIMNLTFLPSWMWDQIEKRTASRSVKGTIIWYDADCAFCFKICRVLAVFLFVPSVRIEPAQSDATIGPLLKQSNSWVLTREGETHLRWHAMIALIAASPVFWPCVRVMRWSPALRAGELVYRWIVRHRGSLVALSQRLLPIKERSPSTGPISNLFGAMALLFVTAQNVSTLPSTGMRLPNEFIAIRQFLGLYQNWTMFAPYPELRSIWPRVDGILTDGTLVDVYNLRMGAASLSRPDVVSQTFKNGRWRKYLANLEDESYGTRAQTIALHYGRYLCRHWAREMPNLAPLSTLVITFHVEDTPPPGAQKATWENVVWHQNCL